MHPVKKTLRWYQQQTVDALMRTLERSPLAVVPTAGGKSLICAELANRIIAENPQSRIVIIVPKRELVTQNYDEALIHCIPERECTLTAAHLVGIYCAGLKRKDTHHQITMSTAASLARSAERLANVTHVIIDECHLVDASSPRLTYARIMVKLTKANKGVAPVAIGLTATPYRQYQGRYVLQTELPKALFRDVVIDLTHPRYFNRLLREGFLARLRHPDRLPVQIAVTNIKRTLGDFDETELAQVAIAATHECITDALALAEYRKHLMWFCVNVLHAEVVYTRLVELGEDAVLVHGSTDDEERDTMLSEFKNREHRHIVSVALLTTGFNAPHVDCIVGLRPTQSPVLHRQMTGRGIRPDEGKDDTLIIDCAGNFTRLGAINAPIAEADSRAELWVCDDENPEGTVQADRRTAVYALPTWSQHQDQETSTLASDSRDAKNYNIYTSGVLTTTLPPGVPAAGAESHPCGHYNLLSNHFCENCGRPRVRTLALKRTTEDDEPRERKLSDELGILLDEEESRSYTRRFHPIELKTSLQTPNFVWTFMVIDPASENKKPIPINYLSNYGVAETLPDEYAVSAQLWRKATGSRASPKTNFKAHTLAHTIELPESLDILFSADGKPLYVHKIVWQGETRPRVFNYSKEFVQINIDDEEEDESTDQDAYPASPRVASNG